MEEGDFIPEGRHWVPDNCKSHQHAGEFGSLDEANEILGLMMRHWDTIASTLYRGDAYVPLLLLDEKGMAYGNDWARGFMCGMHMRHDGWAADSHKQSQTPFHNPFHIRRKLGGLATTCGGSHGFQVVEFPYIQTLEGHCSTN